MRIAALFLAVAVASSAVPAVADDTASEMYAGTSAVSANLSVHTRRDGAYFLLSVEQELVALDRAQRNSGSPQAAVSYASSVAYSMLGMGAGQGGYASHSRGYDQVGDGWLAFAAGKISNAQLHQIQNDASDLTSAMPYVEGQSIANDATTDRDAKQVARELWDISWRITRSHLTFPS